MDESRTGTEGVVSGPSGKPPNFVAGVIDDAAAFEKAVQDLVDAGIDRDSIGVLQGERGAETIAGRHGGGVRSWLHRASEALSDEHEYLDRYEAEARQGHYVIGVPLPETAGPSREQVRAILTQHGGRLVVSSTPWTHGGSEEG